MCERDPERRVAGEGGGVRRQGVRRWRRAGGGGQAQRGRGGQGCYAAQHPTQPAQGAQLLAGGTAQARLLAQGGGRHSPLCRKLEREGKGDVEPPKLS